MIPKTVATDAVTALSPSRDSAVGRLQTSAAASRHLILQSLNSKMDANADKKVHLQYSAVADNDVDHDDDDDDDDSHGKTNHNGTKDSTNSNNNRLGNRSGSFVTYMETILNNNELNNRNRRHTFALSEALKAKAIILENISSQVNANSATSKKKRKLKRDNYSMSNKKLKALAKIDSDGFPNGPSPSVTLHDLNLLHELWILYALDIVKDCRGTAQLQARFQNVELIGAFVCATDLSEIIDKRSSSNNCGSSNSSSKSNSITNGKSRACIVGIISSVSANCYYITTISDLPNNSELPISADEVSFRIVRVIKKDVALAVALPDSSAASSTSGAGDSTRQLNIVKDTTLIRKSINKYNSSKAEGDNKFIRLLPGLSNSVVNFENVVMIYGK